MTLINKLFLLPPAHHLPHANLTFSHGPAISTPPSPTAAIDPAMPTPAVPAADSFTLDRSLHWARLDPEERPRQEALLEFITTEANYHQRLTTLHQV